MPPVKEPELGEGDEYELRPPGDLTYELDDPKQREIVAWRVACFERLGFGPTAASAMAVRRDIDREQVERMVARGARLHHVVAIVL